MRVQLSKAILAFAISSAVGISPAWGQAQQQPQPDQQQAQPAPTQAAAQPTPTPKQEWKDLGEYNLFQSIGKESDPNKKLDLLKQWTDKYPNTDFKVERLSMYMDTYKALNQPGEMLGTAQQILAIDPKNLQALYWINLLVVSMNDASPQKLDLGEKSANSLLAVAEEYFSPDKRPATTPEDAWKKGKTDIEALAQRTLGWIAWQRKNYMDAVNHFTEDLKLNPNDAEASAWLGTVILAQKKPELQADALYDFARAAAYDGPGALEPVRRQKMVDYVTKAYTNYHGQDAQGLQQLLQTAKSSVFPPAGFKILSSDEVATQNLKQLQQSNPSLALWLRLKDALSQPDAAQYFNQYMKDTLVPPEGQPRFRATVIRQEPVRNPKIVVVGVADPKTPDATLRLETPLAGHAEPGTVIEFRGVAASYTALPFMVTFDTEKKSIDGWPAPPPVPKRAPVHKKTSE